MSAATTTTDDHEVTVGGAECDTASTLSTTKFVATTEAAARQASLARIFRARAQREAKRKADRHNTFGALQQRVGTEKFLQKAAMHFAAALEQCSGHTEARLNLANTLLQLLTVEESRRRRKRGDQKRSSSRRLDVLRTCAVHYSQCIKQLQENTCDARSGGVGLGDANRNDSSDGGGGGGGCGSGVGGVGENSGAESLSSSPSAANATTATAAVAHHNLGVVRLRMEQLVPALRHFLEAVRLCPGYSDAHCNVATTFRLLGE